MVENRGSLALLPFLVVAALAGLAAAAAPGAPLDRTLALNLWGAGLNDAAREIKVQTGVDLLFFRKDLPADQNTDNLYLVTGRVSLRTALECLARRYSFRYRVSRGGEIELSKSYDWLDEKPILHFQGLDDIAGMHDEGGEPLTRLIAEFVKIAPLLPGDFSARVESRPLADGRQARRCISSLPQTLSQYLIRAVDCLGGQAGDYPRPVSQPYASAHAAGVDWPELLEREVAISREGDLRRLLADVAGQTGMALLLHEPAAATAPPLPEGRLGLGAATEELAARYNLGRRVFMGGGAIVFEPGAGWEMDDRSRELYWGGLAVAGFDAGAAAERAGGGDKLVERLRREVFPELWRDPVCSLGYSQVTQRLAAVAPFNVMAEIALRLGRPEAEQ